MVWPRGCMMERELGVLPDWEDVGTVYDRMQGLGLLTLRASPGGITGHIMSLAVFARAARYQDRTFDLNEFIEEYCECKKLDKEDLLERIRAYRENLGHWDTDPITLLEVLSAY